MAGIGDTAQVELSPQFLGHVLATAFAAETGPCWRWARPAAPFCESFGPTDWLHARDGLWQTAMIRTDEGEGLLVTHPVLATGIGRILRDEVAGCPAASEAGKRVARAVAREDGGAIDAEAADAIVQAGVFGQIVYR